MTDSQKLDLILEKVVSSENRLDSIENRLNSIENEVKEVKVRLEKVENRATSTELTLENETNRGIKIIAEGHLDIMRKLNDVLKGDSERELLLLRVTVLENELRKVKERLSEIA